MRRVTFVRLVPLLILAGVLVVPAGAAQADAVRVADTEDVISAAYPNALDIHYATMAHVGNKLTHTITLFRKLNPAYGLTAGYYIGVAFDTDGDYSDPERLLYIFSLDGGLRGRMVTGAGKKVGAIFAVKHPSPRTASATFPARLLGSPSSYGWFAFARSATGSKCCLDTAPNRNWVVHDIGAPVVTEPSLAPPAGSTWASTTVPVDFSVADVGGSGLDGWTLRQRVRGASSWTTVASGTSEGAQSATFTGADGQSYDACVQAVDRDGNVANGQFHLVSFPLDDAGSAFTYSGSWSTGGSSADYQSTLHTTSSVGDKATIIVNTPGNPYLVVPGGYDGVADVTLNGVHVGTTGNNGAVGSRQVRPVMLDYSQMLNVPAPYTLEMAVTAGTLVVDGLLVLPLAGSTPPAKEPCG